MIPEEIKKILRNQHYEIIGKNSAIQICRWTKKSLVDKGYCYKQKFYGIESHRCCQMTPVVMNCYNRCIHCWRAIEYNLGVDIKKEDVDDPKKIIEDCIKAQRKLLSGFKGNSHVNIKKFEEAQDPKHFAISLSGEPTLYPKLAELIKELRKQKRTSFLVTNGLNPNRLKELRKKNALPTQLYVSLNTPNEKLYKVWHRSILKNAWERFNESLEIIKKLTKTKKTRTVLRLTMVRELNLKNEYIDEFKSLITKASPDFIEIKGYMAVGYARKRLGYEKMPTHKEIKDFAIKLVKNLEDYKILDEKEESRVVLIGKDKKRIKIKEEEI